MKKDYILVVFIAITIMFTAWFLAYASGSFKTQDTPSEQLAAETLTTQEACEQHGHTWKAVGKAQFYTCIEQYSDGGEACESSEDCQGDCIKKRMDEPATCELSSDRFGCGNTVENIAKGEGILCID